MNFILQSNDQEKMEAFLTRTSTVQNNNGAKEEQKKNTRSRNYQECFLKYGFSWAEDLNGPLPLCVVCGTKLANESMVTTRLKRHLHTKHGQLEGKPLEHFQKLLKAHSKQVSIFKKVVTVSD